VKINVEKGCPRCFGIRPAHRGPCPGYACPWLDDCVSERAVGTAVIVEDEHNPNSAVADVRWEGEDDAPMCVGYWREWGKTCSANGCRWAHKCLNGAVTIKKEGP